MIGTKPAAQMTRISGARKISVLRWLVLLGSIIILSFISGGAGHAQAPPDLACRGCHGDNQRELTLPSGETLPLLVPLDLLDQSVGAQGARSPNETIQHKLLEVAMRDIDELLPQLDPRAEELAEVAIQKLRKRGEREEKDLSETLERQRKRVIEELEKHEGQYTQRTLDFDEEEKRQLQSNMSAWRRRLEQFDHDLEQEPQRIRKFYEVRARRVEPVGLVYLWPETN